MGEHSQVPPTPRPWLLVVVFPSPVVWVVVEVVLVVGTILETGGGTRNVQRARAPIHRHITSHYCNKYSPWGMCMAKS